MNAISEFHDPIYIEPWHAKAIAAEFELDLTDNWQQETDPDSEFGEICTGLFEVASESGTINLIGLRLEDGGQPVYCDREYAIQMLGGAEVIRVELALERGDISFDTTSGDSSDEAFDLYQEGAA